MVSSHALVNYIASVRNEGSSYTVATPKTRGERDSDSYAGAPNANALACAEKMSRWYPAGTP